jgi:phage portal protein BeeE
MASQSEGRQLVADGRLSEVDFPLAKSLNPYHNGSVPHGCAPLDATFTISGGFGISSDAVDTSPPPSTALAPRFLDDSPPSNFGVGRIADFQRTPDFQFKSYGQDAWTRAVLNPHPTVFAPESEKSYGGGYGLNSGYGMWAGALLAGLRANAPGAWSADRLKQAQHFIGIAFTAISAVCDGVSSAILEVTDMDLEKEIQNHLNVQKSISETNRRGIKVPYDHELVQLFEEPNPNDTFKDHLYKTTQQLCLTGNNLTWMVPNRLALPSELYSIPTALAYPVPYSQAWPRGAWRLTPLYPYGPFAVLPTPVATAGAVVPADDVLHMKLPHPLLTWDGYSPLTAGARQIDLMEMMDDARWAAMDGGINPSMIFTVNPEQSGVNFNQDMLDNFTARLVQKYANTKNFGKGMILPPGVDGKPTSMPPADMAFDSGWEQMRDFILSLWRVPKGVVGITESSSYAALYASLKQFALIGLKPMAEFIAQHWTKKLARKFDRALRISLPLPTLDDPHLLEEQLKTDLQAGIRKNDEWRALRGLVPIGGEWGDQLAGGQAETSEGLPGDKASVTDPKDKPGSAPVNERRDEADDARPNNTDGLHALPGMGGRKSMPTAPTVHKYSSTQFNLPDDVATRIKAIGLRIRDDDLAGKGLEGLVHCTIKYGLVVDDPSEVMEAVRGFGPVTCTLGRVSVFDAIQSDITASVAQPGTPVVTQQAQRGSPEFDVLKVDVHGERLYDLNRLLSDTFPHHDSHPKFCPHVTIAYLRPGIGADYMGSVELEGTEITFTSMIFSDSDGHVTFIPLAPSRISKAFAPSVNGHAKMMTAISSDLIPPPSIEKPTRLRRQRIPGDPPPSQPRRSLPFTGKRQAQPRKSGDLTTVYPPPDAKPYPTPSPPPGPTPPPPEANAPAVSGLWWHPPEFEWRLFQTWADRLPPQYPTIHNLSEHGWCRGPKILSTELLSATADSTAISSSELRLALLALISICETEAGEVSVFVQPEVGDDPGRPLVTDMMRKALTPEIVKTIKDDSGHEHDSGSGQFSTTDTAGASDKESESKDKADSTADSPLPNKVPDAPAKPEKVTEKPSDAPAFMEKPSKSATESAASEFSSIVSELSSPTADHDALFSRVDSLVESTIDAIPNEIDAFEDEHIASFTEQFGQAVFDRAADTVFEDFSNSIRAEEKNLALAVTEYGDAIADAIEAQANGEDFDADALAAAEKAFKKSQLSVRLDIRHAVRTAERDYQAFAKELDQEWQSTAAQAAEQMMSDDYADDLESAKEDSIIYNRELANSGNPYRIELDESDPLNPEWVYNIPESEPDTATTKSLSTAAFQEWRQAANQKSIPSFRRRVPPALISAGGIVPPPSDFAAALSGLTSVVSSFPQAVASIIAASRGGTKRIKPDRNEDGSINEYVISEE